jgi:hypothetical protein
MITTKLGKVEAEDLFNYIHQKDAQIYYKTITVTSPRTGISDSDITHYLHAFANIVVSTAAASRTMKVHDPTESPPGKMYMIVTSQMITRWCCFYCHSLEETIFVIINLGIDTDFTTAHMDQGGREADLNNYWFRCSKVEEPLSRDTTGKMIARYEHCKEDTMWMDEVMAIEAAIQEFENSNEEKGLR